MKWTVVVPLRALPSAKSRLAETVPAEIFADLVAAIRADTLAAAGGAAPVARVIVVADTPGPGVELVQRTPGLNGALRDAAEHARTHWPADGVAALVGDLPALRPHELAEALDAAAGHPSAFVPDEPGTGTTMLTARPGTDLDPRFGAGSAGRHGEIATALDAGPGLRHDVDTAADLAAAARVGVGVHTAILFDPDTALPR